MIVDQLKDPNILAKYCVTQLPACGILAVRSGKDDLLEACKKIASASAQAYSQLGWGEATKIYASADYKIVVESSKGILTLEVGDGTIICSTADATFEQLLPRKEVLQCIVPGADGTKKTGDSLTSCVHTVFANYTNCVIDPESLVGKEPAKYFNGLNDNQQDKGEPKAVGL